MLLTSCPLNALFVRSTDALIGMFGTSISPMGGTKLAVVGSVRFLAHGVEMARGVGVLIINARQCEWMIVLNRGVERWSS